MRNCKPSPAAYGAYPPEGYYEWAPPAPLSIRISYEVIDRLAKDVMKAFRSLPQRGAEIGGILIGRAGEGEHPTVTVDEYEAVPCEYRRGPSYMLSETDRRRLEKALRRASAKGQVVGFFRSHTRLGLYLDEPDFSVIQSYFTSPAHVFLLVRPDAARPATAGFFFWEDGHIQRQSTYLEFPFSAADLRKLAAPETRLEEVAPEMPPARAEHSAPVHRDSPARTPPPPQTLRLVEPPAAARPEQRVRRPPRRRMAAIAALVLAGFGLLEYEVLKLVNHSTGGAALADSTPSLRVERNGKYLQVNWNRRAPAVRNAERGLLSIDDGAYRRELELDAGQLRTGAIAYLPSGDDVSFRLELWGPGAGVSESLRVVNAAGSAARKSAPAREPVPAHEPHVTAVEPMGPTRGSPAPTLEEPVTKAQLVKRPRERPVWYDDGL